MLEAFLEELQRGETLEDLNASVVSLRNTLEVDHVVYHSVKSTGDQYAALTYAPEWVERYIEKDYARIDPVVQASLRRFHPVDWSKIEWSGKTVREFMGEAMDNGIGEQGLTVPIRGPSGQFALFSISSKDSPTNWNKFTQENTRKLLLISHFINQRALEIERGSDQVETANLSPRETDALTMLALGLSRAQAADTLSISEHTLRVYIESARFKLAAMNTTHAVARALSQGLLLI